MKKCQQNIEPIGDLLEQQIHIAIVRSFTKWVEMFFELAFKDRPFRIFASYSVFKLDMRESQHLLGHQKCTFKS